MATTLTKPTKPAKRALGRGLAALIPESDFDLLNNVARGHIAPSPIATPSTSAPDVTSPQNVAKPTLRDSTLSDAGGANQVVEAPVAVPLTDIRYIAIADIEPNPFQPRQVFSEEELENLAASVREHGVLQPVLVRPLSGGGSQKIPTYRGRAALACGDSCPVERRARYRARCGR